MQAPGRRSAAKRLRPGPVYASHAYPNFLELRTRRLTAEDDPPLLGAADLGVPLLHECGSVQDYTTHRCALSPRPPVPPWAQVHVTAFKNNFGVEEPPAPAAHASGACGSVGQHGFDKSTMLHPLDLRPSNPHPMSPSRDGFRKLRGKRKLSADSPAPRCPVPAHRSGLKDVAEHPKN
jgi:hypothetical protein